MVHSLIRGRRPAAAAIAALALALSACGGEAQETELATDAQDMSGGEMIVSEQDPAAVPVDTPDTMMTPVPDGDAATQGGMEAELGADTGPQAGVPPAN